MKTIQLQSIGHKPAIEAQDLNIGDVTIWNFGGLETIISVVAETKCFITFKIRCEETGNLHERRLKKTRLVGISKRAKKEKVKVTYAQVKEALELGFISPLNSKETKHKPTPVKKTFSLVVYKCGEYKDVFTNYDKKSFKTLKA